MELIDKINTLYEQIGERILRQFSGTTKINFERQVDRRIGTFSIVMEVIVIEKARDDDYGLVFATNVQVDSHYTQNTKDLSHNGGLFIMSDLSTGDGRIIDSTEEFILFPNNDESEDYAFKKIERFVHAIAPSIHNTIIERYGLK